MSSLQGFFSFSWYAQATYLAFFIVSMYMMRLNPIANFTDQVLLGWMDSTRQDVHDFVPMTFHCWFFHYTMMLVGLEMIMTLAHKMTKTKQKINNGGSSDSDIDNNHLVSTMRWIFTINAIQGHLTCLSHACIDIHPVLENKLNTLAYKLFLPTAVFLTGIIGVFPKTGWYVAPLMAYATYTNQVGFHNIAGRGKFVRINSHQVMSYHS